MDSAVIVINAALSFITKLSWIFIIFVKFMPSVLGLWSSALYVSNHHISIKGSFFIALYLLVYYLPLSFITIIIIFLLVQITTIYCSLASWIASSSNSMAFACPLFYEQGQPDARLDRTFYTHYTAIGTWLHLALCSPSFAEPAAISSFHSTRNCLE